MKIWIILLCAAVFSTDKIKSTAYEETENNELIESNWRTNYLAKTAKCLVGVGGALLICQWIYCSTLHPEANSSTITTNLVADAQKVVWPLSTYLGCSVAKNALTKCCPLFTKFKNKLMCELEKSDCSIRSNASVNVCAEWEERNWPDPSISRPIEHCEEKYSRGKHIGSGMYHDVFEVIWDRNLVYRTQQRESQRRNFTQSELDERFKKELKQHETLKNSKGFVTAKCYISNKNGNVTILPKVHAPQAIELEGTAYDKYSEGGEHENMRDTLISHVYRVYGSLNQVIVLESGVCNGDWELKFDEFFNQFKVHNLALSSDMKPLFIDADPDFKDNLAYHAKNEVLIKKAWDVHNELLQDSQWKIFTELMTKRGFHWTINM